MANRETAEINYDRLVVALDEANVQEAAERLRSLKGQATTRYEKLLLSKAQNFYSSVLQALGGKLQPDVQAARNALEKCEATSIVKGCRARLGKALKAAVLTSKRPAHIGHPVRSAAIAIPAASQQPTSPALDLPTAQMLDMQPQKPDRPQEIKRGMRIQQGVKDFDTVVQALLLENVTTQKTLSADVYAELRAIADTMRWPAFHATSKKSLGVLPFAVVCLYQLLYLRQSTQSSVVTLSMKDFPRAPKQRHNELVTDFKRLVRVGLRFTVEKTRITCDFSQFAKGQSV